MQLSNKHNLPETVFRAIEATQHRYESDDRGDITTTQLIDPVQVVTLKLRHDKETSEDIMDRLWSLQGQMLHMILELGAPKGSDVEKRVAAEISGWKLTGKYDYIDDGILIDYKYTSVWSFVFGRKEWEYQANVNRWLLHKNGVEIKGLVNYLMFRDWSESKVGSRNYPKEKMIPITLPMWPLADAESYVMAQVKAHKEARNKPDNELPKCSKEDRWFNERTQKFGRCEKYCSASIFCQQFLVDKQLIV